MYRDAGEWLDNYISDDSYWQRKEDKLELLKNQEGSLPDAIYQKRVHQLEEEIKERRTPAILIRFGDARHYLQETSEGQLLLSSDEAKRFLFVGWLLTDPDAEKSGIELSNLQKWPWEPVNDVTNMTRGVANALWIQSGQGYKQFVKMVRLAWQTIQHSKAKRKSNSNAVVGDICNLGPLSINWRNLWGKLSRLKGWKKAAAFTIATLFIILFLTHKIGIPHIFGDSPDNINKKETLPEITTTGPNSPVTLNYGLPSFTDEDRNDLKSIKNALQRQMNHIDMSCHQQLIQNYPLGYALFTIVGNDEIVTHSTNRMQEGWNIDWNDARVVSIDNELIMLRPPNLFSKQGNNVVTDNVFGAKRREGYATRILGTPMEVYIGVLSDKPNGIICFIGWKEKQRSKDK